MGWRIVEITSESYLKLFLNNLIINNVNLGRITIPIDDIDTLIIDNFCSSLTIQTINKLIEKNVNVVVCDTKHLPSGAIIPFFGNYNTVKIFEKQISWTQTFKGQCWQENITKKIEMQISLLNFLKISTKEMCNIMKEVQHFDISNREGHASKIYWHALFGKKFNRKDPKNPINSLLNYGYAILLSYFTRSIVKKGLDTRISLFHKSFSNYQALSCDLMEVFRSFVDFEIYKIYINNEVVLLSEAKSKIISAFNKKILINGRYQFMCNGIDDFIDHFIKFGKIADIKQTYDWE